MKRPISLAFVLNVIIVIECVGLIAFAVAWIAWWL